MSCSFTEQVSLLIDGELSPGEASQVERHVGTCSECQAARADFLNLRREIADYHVALDPRAQEQVLADILAGRSRTATPLTIKPSWRERLVASFGVPSFATAMATACALLLIAGVVGVAIYRNAHRSEPTIAQAPPTVSPVPQTSSAKPPEPEQQAQVTDRDQQPSPKREVIQTASNPPRPSLERGPRPEPAANYVAVNATAERVTSADAETLTAQHVEQASLLLRTFRNTRPGANADISYEKRRARELLYQNMMLRREAANSGNVQVANLLDSLEPVLIDMANMPARPSRDQVQTLNQRMERKNLVPLLQISSTELAKAFD